MNPLNLTDKIEIPIEDIISEAPIAIQCPLHVAIESNDIELVKRLLESSDIVANINAKNEKDESPLYVAVSKGSEEIVELLLQYNQIKVDIGGYKSKTPLHLAAENGFVNIAKALINAGANVNAEYGESGTPIFFALNNEYTKESTATEMLKLLIEAKADVNHVNKKGETPLLKAVLCEYTEAIKLLINNKADIGFKFQHAEAPTILSQAVWQDKTKSVQALVDCGANINYLDKYGHNLLFFVLNGKFIRQDMKMLQLLTKLGLDINWVDKEGHTLLHEFAFKQYRFDKKLFQELIKLNVKVNKPNKYGYTPLHCAVSMGHEKMVSALVENGADVNATSMSVESPLSLAREKHYGTKIDKLLTSRANVRTKIEVSAPIISALFILLDLVWALAKSIYKTVFAIASNVIKFVCKQGNIKPWGAREETDSLQPSKTHEASANLNDDYAKTAIFTSYLCQYFMNTRQNLRVSKLLSNPVNLTKTEISKLSGQVFKAPGLKFFYNALIIFPILLMINSSVDNWCKVYDKSTSVPSKYTYAKNGVYIATPAFFVSDIISYVVHAWDITPQLTDYKISQFIKQCCVSISSKYDTLLSKTFVPEFICSAVLCAVGFFIGKSIDESASSVKITKDSVLLKSDDASTLLR